MWSQYKTIQLVHVTLDVDKNTQDPFFVCVKFGRSSCATLRKKVDFFSPRDLHTIFTTEDLLKHWRTYPNPSSLLLLSLAKPKKKKIFFFSESSKLCSIAYYSCRKGSVFGSRMSGTKSWLQAACRARSQSRRGQRGVQAGEAHLAGISGEAVRTGGEKRHE